MNRRPSGRPARMRGLSIIEILITMALIAVGILALAGMQLRAGASQKASWDRKAAAELTLELAERVRANHVGHSRNAYVFSLAPGDAVPAATACAPCTPEQLARIDLAQWSAMARMRLGDASGVSVTTQDRMLVVTVAWPEVGADTVEVAAHLHAACETVSTEYAYRCTSTRVFP